MRAQDIATAHTPRGGYGSVMPPPVLALCSDALAPGVPDLRGLWQVIEVTTMNDGSSVLDASHKVLGLLQRIEQAGQRIVITSGGVLHDMYADGTVENGVQDVAEFDKATPISVIATYENGVHVLRPVGIPIEVKRWRASDDPASDLLWQYIGFTCRCRLVDDETNITTAQG